MVCRTFKLTTEEFVNKARIIHGDEYDYSLVDYKLNKVKVIIICKAHGKFEQKPNSHLNGKGCDRCSGTFELSTNEFIEMAMKIHGDLYDYSDVIYEKSSKKVKIICKIHGRFEQSPNGHLSGNGCRDCANALLALTNNEFITKCKIIHGDIYDYTLTKYESCRKNVDIICLKHGKFTQKAGTHLEGKGCKYCSNNISKQEIKWLDSLMIAQECRHKSIKANDKWYFLDAYIPETNTIYEFHGDYWHGNPVKFKPEDVNKNNKTKFGELYEDTINRENELRALGYNLVVIWENDWNKLQKQLKKIKSDLDNFDNMI